MDQHPENAKVKQAINTPSSQGSIARIASYLLKTKSKRKTLTNKKWKNSSPAHLHSKKHWKTFFRQKA